MPPVDQPPQSPMPLRNQAPPTSPLHVEVAGNNISSGTSLAIQPNTISEAVCDSGSLFALLDNFLLCGPPIPNLHLPSFIDFPHMAGYFQMDIEQANRCVPLMPE